MALVGQNRLERFELRLERADLFLEFGQLPRHCLAFADAAADRAELGGLRVDLDLLRHLVEVIEGAGARQRDHDEHADLAVPRQLGETEITHVVLPSRASPAPPAAPNRPRPSGRWRGW